MDIISAQFGPLGGPFMASTEEQTTGLVVLLHGYGANGLDLFGLASPCAPRCKTLGWRFGPPMRQKFCLGQANLWPKKRINGFRSPALIAVG